MFKISVPENIIYNPDIKLKHKDSDADAGPSKGFVNSFFWTHDKYY